MKKNFRNLFVRTVLVSCAVVGSTLMLVAPVSCRHTDDGIEYVPVDTTPPHIEEFYTTGKKTVSVKCSEKIVLDNITVQKVDEKSAEPFDAGGAANNNNSSKVSVEESVTSSPVSENSSASSVSPDSTSSAVAVEAESSGVNVSEVEVDPQQSSDSFDSEPVLQEVTSQDSSGSEPVSQESVTQNPSDKNGSNSGEKDDVFAVANAITYSEDGKSAEIEISADMEVGVIYVVSGVMLDETGNSLEFSQKVNGYNEKQAMLIFNEIRTSYDKKKSAVEFVEFFVLKSGNTFGLEYVSAALGETKKYTFPAIEVKQGMYITLHGKILEGMEADAVEELGDNLALSKTFESCDTARDLWMGGTEKIASNSDVLVIRDSDSKEIKDAVLLSPSGKSTWSKKQMREFAGRACSLGIWPAGSAPENAVCTDSMSSSIYRSISRKNTKVLAESYSDENDIPEYIETSSSDWIITDKVTAKKVTVSGATPGYENSTNVFVEKAKK
jgi:hypothetical protein